MVDGDCLPCQLSRSAASKGCHFCSEFDSFCLEDHCGQCYPWIVCWYTLIALPDDIVFQENTIPTGIFGKLGKVCECACVTPWTAVWKTESVLHIDLLATTL